MDHETRTETQNYQTNHQFGRLPKGERRVRFADSMGMELVSIFLFDLIRNAYLDSFHSQKCLQAPPPSSYSLQMAARSLQKQPLAPTLHHNHNNHHQQNNNNNNNNNTSTNTSNNSNNTDNNNNNNNNNNSTTSSDHHINSSKVSSHSLQNGVHSIHRNHSISNNTSHNHSHRKVNTSSSNSNSNHYHSYYTNKSTASSLSSLTSSSSQQSSPQSSSSTLSLSPSLQPPSVAAASSFVCEFTQPISLISFKERVKLNKVHLETCQINSSAGHVSVSCTIRVLNVSFDKSVLVRYTTDDWRTHTDSLASYKPGSCDGWSDKFSSTFSITNQAKVLQPGQRIIFAIRYTIDGDKVHWDNNGGLNYSIKSMC